MYDISKMQNTASTLFSAYASLAASMMLVRTMANDIIPKSLLTYIQSAISYLFTPLSTQLTIIVDEQCGMTRNQVYEAAEIYLRTKIGPNADKVRAHKTPKQKNINVSIEKDEEITDVYGVVQMKWRLVSVEPQDRHGYTPEKRFFELSFNKRFKESVLNEYLPFVLTKAKEIQDNDRAVKLYTRDCPCGSDDDGYGYGGGGGGVWGSINLDHPATFDTLAMEPEMKKMIIEDLDRFVKRRDFYKKVGKAWKRGYLLYGPPGTGKSSLIAAMANYLKFDIYDLELTSLYSNSELRRILISTSNRSIIVIEDIDCSVEMHDRNLGHQPSDTKITLSGLLNFIDGLWSNCGDERIIVFTTNHKEKLDPALLRPGRMDMHIHMSYCTNQSFKILAFNYLGVSDHRLFGEIEGLIKNVEVTPAEVAEELMRSEDAEVVLEGVLNLLKRKADEANEIKEEKSLHSSFSSSSVTEMKVPRRSARQKNLQKDAEKEEAINLLEQKENTEEAVERSKDEEAVEEENFVESPVVSDDDDDEDFSDDGSLGESGSEDSHLSGEEDVFVSSDNEDSFDAKSDDVSGNGASGSGRDDTGHGKDDDAESDDSRTVVEESDSSEDEVDPRNTVGDVPLKWYKEEEHIGYDLAGKKIKKKERQDKLDSFLASVDDSKNWRKIYDEYNDEEVELTKEEVKVIKRLLKGKAPHADFDPYAPYVDWFSWDDSKHPLSSAPEPKRRFIPSKWESKKVVQYVRAIRKGLIKFDEKPKEEPSAYLLWGDDSSAIDRQGLAYIPAPKPKLPGHEESYNPSLEYIPTQEEINSYQLMFEEDRPKFIPKRFTSLRNVPAYEKAVNENFGRCLDLYLCPRARKKRINIDPESLKPKLPSRKDLRPYPTSCYLEYKGHKGPVVSISTESTGQWIASGSSDGTVRIWEVETGRCVRIWELGESVSHVSWNPLPERPILAACMGEDVYLLNTGLGNAEEQKSLEELLHVETPSTPDDSDNDKIAVNWVQDDKNGGIRLKHFKTVSSVEWHRKGDYFSTLMPSAQSKAVLIHMLSKKQTQRIPFKLHGLPVSTAFHPSRSAFFISTKKNIRVYDLLKQKLIKKLETGVREVSSIAVHPGGDNLIVGSKDGKLCWFDMDLSSQPYRVLNCHPKDINRVAFHRSYPLFASSSDDCTAYVFHGMVYSDLNQNPLIVPLEILRGHASENGRGVMDCKFHPRQPWLFTAGADSVIKLYCH